MMPPNAPATCPRRLDDTSGPRACSLTLCPLHLRGAVNKGPSRLARRERAAAKEHDTCTIDVAERCGPLTFARIGEILGTSPQAAHETARRALDKIAPHIDRRTLIKATAELRGG